MCVCVCEYLCVWSYIICSLKIELIFYKQIYIYIYHLFYIPYFMQLTII